MNSALILIPARDEEPSLGEVLQRTRRVVPGCPTLVVDDGSADQTGAVARRAGAEVLEHGSPLGYGQALMTGFDWAHRSGFEVVVTLDADLQHEPEFIPRFLATLESAGIAAGTRYHPFSGEAGRTPPDRRHINGQVTRLLNELTGLARTDAFCGFNGYRLSVLRRFKLDQPGYLLTLQVWLEAARHKIDTQEVPIRRVYREPRSFGARLDDPQVRLGTYLDFLRNHSAARVSEGETAQP